MTEEIRDAAERYAKQLEWERMQPLGPLLHLRHAHVMRGEGDGTTVYFGRHRGAGYVGVSLRGFHGWSSSRWMPGGWEFLTPHVSAGRLGSDSPGRWWEARVLVPARLWDFYRWRVRPSGRRYMRDRSTGRD